MRSVAFMTAFLCIGLGAGAQEGAFTAVIDPSCPLAAEGLKTGWAPDDAVSVSPLSGDREAPGLEARTEEGGTAARFEGDLPLAAKAVCAVYPAGAVLSWNPSGKETGTLQFQTVIKPRQRVVRLAVKDGIARYADPEVLWLAARPSRKAPARFRQVGTYLRFTVPAGASYRLRKVVIKGTRSTAADEPAPTIAGKVNYNLRDAEVREGFKGSSRQVDVSDAFGQTLQPGTYYVAIRPRYSDDDAKNYPGFSLLLTDADGRTCPWVPVQKAWPVLEPGALYDLGTLPGELDFE
ncbi:MAG: hypothetical protein IJ721_04420 [Bacteroidales bacterium]|nr:hypothetical protein [Bacteroidales bacterium]